MGAIMRAALRAPRSTARMFALYAAISLIPVIVLGVILGASLRSEANRRGLAEGRSEAILLAHTGVQPPLSGDLLEHGLRPSERAGLERLGSLALARGEVLRLRLRDLTGRVVFSADGSGFNEPADDEALDAAHGEVVARLTRLNGDSPASADVDESTGAGVAAVEVYLPLTAGRSPSRIGVLELYLPYAPIARDLTAGLHRKYVDLA